MKPVPLLLLLSSVLLSSHLRPATGRPRILPGWLDGSGRLQTQQQLAQVLLRAAAAGDSAASDLLGDNILRFLQKRNTNPLRLLPPEEESEEDEAVRTAAQLWKRNEEPPLSIDLTFHLLRNMIQMAKIESQREQAQLNRKVLDENKRKQCGRLKSGQVSLLGCCRRYHRWITYRKECSENLE
ncbi:urotensin 1 isoform X2 [Perca fluviatilis]|nr:urotensin 1 isoform X2 [Perca fluviatilis]